MLPINSVLIIFLIRKVTIEFAKSLSDFHTLSLSLRTALNNSLSDDKWLYKNYIYL